MGATFAVSLAQRAALAIMTRAGLGKALILPGERREFRGSMGAQMPYIDDCNSVGTSATGVNEATKRIIAVLHKHGLQVAEKKTQWAGYGLPECALGLWWCPTGILTTRM